MRHAAGMARRAAPGKARHRKVKAAPEEMHRACLAEEAGTKLLEHPIGIGKHLEKAPYRRRIVGGMPVVLRKPDRLRQFVGHLIDRDVDAELGEIGHDGRVETRDRLPGQRKLPPGAVAGRNPQNMIDQVEVDLKCPDAVGDRRGRQPPRGDIERDVPGMVQPGSAREAHLADDLGPKMQRFISLAPCRGRQFRPGNSRGVAHGSPWRAGGHRHSRHDKAGRDRPGLYTRTRGNWGWPRYFLLASLAKAASTSSFLMRAAGLPGWPRFCSSVPSPIMPVWVSGFFAGFLGADLLVMPEYSGCGCARPNLANLRLVPPKSATKAYPGAVSRIGGFGASTLAARSAEQAAAIPAPRDRLHRVARQLIDKENFDHGEARRPPPTNGGAFTEENAAAIASAMQFLCRLRDHASLIARAGEFVVGGLAAAVAAGDRGGAIGRAAGDVIELHLAGEAVVQADDGHAEMQQVGDDREKRGLLAAVLGRGRGKGAADLAVQRALHPEAAGLVEEIRHLRGHGP